MQSCTYFVAPNKRRHLEKQFKRTYPQLQNLSPGTYYLRFHLTVFVSSSVDASEALLLALRIHNGQFRVLIQNQLPLLLHFLVYSFISN